MEDGMWESAPTAPVPADGGVGYEQLLSKPLNEGEYEIVQSIEKDPILTLF